MGITVTMVLPSKFGVDIIQVCTCTIVTKPVNTIFTTTMLGQFQSGVKTILFRLAYGT